MTVRRLLFQVHMWIGLGLGLLLVALGLSGSAIVYDDELARLLTPPPQATAQGAPQSLEAIVAAARAATHQRGPATVTPATAPGEAAIVRIGMAGRGGAGRGRGMQVTVDPVSAQVLGQSAGGLPPVLAFAHQLHGNFLMGQPGRRFVGYLGAAMVLLGLSGLVLWWPRQGQWKNAFKVRRTAKGLRFHRELHGMVGIWAFIVFIIVSFSGVVLAWPQLMGAPQGGGQRDAARIEPVDGVTPIGADRAIEIVRAAVPGMTLRSVTLPARPGQAITVTYLSHGAVNANAVVDPYRQAIVATTDPSGNVMAWQRPVHQGTLGPVWRFLVFLSGFLPALFVFTGVVMWVKKRQARITMTAPLVAEAAE